MPAVFVRYAPDFAERDEDEFFNFTAILRENVAEALDVPENPEARLTADDVEVFADPIGPFDQVGYLICITIFFNDYPERVANLEERRLKIQAEVAENLACFGFSGRGDLYLIPGPNCWGEFGIRALIGGEMVTPGSEKDPRVGRGAFWVQTR